MLHCGRLLERPAGRLLLLTSPEAGGELGAAQTLRLAAARARLPVHALPAAASPAEAYRLLRTLLSALVARAKQGEEAAQAEEAAEAAAEAKALAEAEAEAAAEAAAE